MFKSHDCPFIGTFHTSSVVYTGFDARVSLEVGTDGDGIKSSSLREILENWPPNTPKPKVLYSVPVCSLFCALRSGVNPLSSMVVIRQELPLRSKENVKLSSWLESMISLFSKVRSVLQNLVSSVV